MFKPLLTTGGYEGLEKAPEKTTVVAGYKHVERNRFVVVLFSFLGKKQTVHIDLSSSLFSHDSTGSSDGGCHSGPGCGCGGGSGCGCGSGCGSGSPGGGDS